MTVGTPTIMDIPQQQTSDAAPWLQVLGSRYLTSWMAEQQVGLALTTYQTGKLFLVGRNCEERISVFERTFNRSMGLWASPDARTLWMSSQYQLWRFENALTPGSLYDGYDCLYVPRRVSRIRSGKSIEPSCSAAINN